MAGSSPLRGILTVFRKEFFENLRDRRTLMSALLLGPVFGPLMFLLLVQLTVKQSEDAVDQPIAVAISHADRAPNFVEWLGARSVDITRVDFTEPQARAAVLDRTHKIVLMIPEDFGKRLASQAPAPVQVFADSSRQFDSRTVNRIKTLTTQYGQQIAQLRLVARGVDPLIGLPIAVQDVDVATPASRSTLLLGMLSYIVLFTMLFGGMYLAIDATAGERERGSLESLLTTPVPRRNLIYGKILAAATYMLISLVLTVTALTVAVQFMGLERFGMAANLTPQTAPIVIAFCAPIALLGASFLTIVAAFTKSYREAQSYLGMVITVPTMPLLFAGIFGVVATAKLMSVPFLSQHLLITSILRAEPLTSQFVALSIGTTLALGLVLAWIAGRLYDREALLG
jgi:sodium transport system permease protein